MPEPAHLSNLIGIGEIVRSVQLEKIMVISEAWYKIKGYQFFYEWLGVGCITLLQPMEEVCRLPHKDQLVSIEQAYVET